MIKKLLIILIALMSLSTFSDTTVNFVFKSDYNFRPPPVPIVDPQPIQPSSPIPIYFELSSSLNIFDIYKISKENFVLRNPDYPNPSSIENAMLGIPFEYDVYQIVMNVNPMNKEREITAQISAKYKIMTQLPQPPIPPSTIPTPPVWEEHDFTIFITDPIVGDLIMPYGPTVPEGVAPIRFVDGLDETGLTVTSQKNDNSTYTVFIIANPK